MPKAWKVILPLIFLVFLIPLGIVYGEASDMTSTFELKDTNAQDGDILSLNPKEGLIRTLLPYDSHLFGVVYAAPLMVFKTENGVNEQPVVRVGTAQVNITTLGGEIRAGDYITSSPITGKGQKATDSGYVLGIALTNFTSSDGPQTTYQPPNSKEPKQISEGKVAVALKIEYAEINKARSLGRLFDAMNFAIFSSIEDPGKAPEVFRYITAGLVVLIGFGIGFFTFSRSIPKSIEAIGRNPLAEKAIMFSIILNIALTILTASVGIIAAAFILRL